MTPGRLITFEGGEGSGKSTLAARLTDDLRQLGIDVLLTREPGGSPGAEEIRRLLVEGAERRWSPVTETLLHYAARRDHLDYAVLPAIAAGLWVVSDRFADSTMAYQGSGQGADPSMIRALHHLAVGTTRPDLTVIIDVPIAIGLARAARRQAVASRYEAFDRDFHERVRQGFLAIAAEDPDRCVVIDGTPPEEQVRQDVWQVVARRFSLAAPP